MARWLNRVTLVGNLGSDPEISTLRSGAKVANLRIATSEVWKDKATGEKREATEWHRVVIFGDGFIAAVVETMLKKGSRVLVEGMLKTRKWQAADGSDRYSTEIHLSPFRGQLIPLDRREGGSAGGGDYDAPPRDNGAAGADFDDDIPF